MAVSGRQFLRLLLAEGVGGKLNFGQGGTANQGIDAILRQGIPDLIHWGFYKTFLGSPWEEMIKAGVGQVV